MDGYGGVAIVIRNNNHVRKIYISYNLFLQLESLDINLVGVELLVPRQFQPGQFTFLPVPI